MTQELTKEQCPDDEQFLKELDKRLKDHWWVTRYEFIRLLRLAQDKGQGKLSMIEAIVEKADKDGSGTGWHFKYQPANGGPIVSRPIMKYGTDWVELDLEGDGSGPFFVHERQMAWAMIDWDCGDAPPYIGQSLSGGKTLS